LYTRPARAGAVDTVLRIPPGETREIHFKVGAPGTYHYWARTDTVSRIAFDTALLFGAMVIDPRGVAANRDRVLVLGSFLSGRILPSGDPEIVWNINGRSWPHTERLAYAVGDSVRLRIINATQAPHPLHLHGFYFRVDSRGTGARDSIYAADARRLGFTERVGSGNTATLMWVPERAGNWLLHCHIVVHFAPRPLLGAARAPLDEPEPHYSNHALEGMSGLVVGLQISDRTVTRVVAGESERRRLRLVVKPDTGGSAKDPAFGYVLQENANSPVASAGLLPGPTIVLKRGEPVGITVVNQLPEPTSVHWHGIELESYFDGVPGFSGDSARIAPVIEPRDSFEARFTPPRSGTFIYHTHAHELRQLRAGLSGALIVVEPGHVYDPKSDVVVLISTPRFPSPGIFINGSLAPAPLDWRVGQSYRLRLINIHQNRASLLVSVMADTVPSTWRPLAKDGVTLSPALATRRPARLQITIGETYDFELTPAAPGPLKIEVRAANQMLLGVLPIRVQ